MQEFGGSAVEAGGSEVANRKRKPNGSGLRRPLLQAVGKILDRLSEILTHPIKFCALAAASNSFDELFDSPLPAEQTIENVLHDIAEKVGKDRWRLKQDEQRDLGFGKI